MNHLHDLTSLIRFHSTFSQPTLNTYRKVNIDEVVQWENIDQLQVCTSKTTCTS